MLKLYYTLPNGKSFAHVSRSGTSTIAAHILKNFYPEKYQEFLEQKEIRYQAPQQFLEERWGNRLPPDCVCMLRNPIDRLKNMLAKNPHYREELVDAVSDVCVRSGKMKRQLSRSISLVRFVHLAPFTNIADNDSKIILFPNFKEACKELDMDYYAEMHENSLNKEAEERYNNIELKERWLYALRDSIGLWEAFTK